MPNPNARLPENQSGRYYVDSQCINCDVCRDLAPANFRRGTTKKYAFVYQQPRSEQEESLCREALLSCPVEAIGDDGSNSRSLN